ncbi:MAG: hypothetical protein WAX89_04220 [Alphaproteobacteria bacterium]
MLLFPKRTLPARKPYAPLHVDNNAYLHVFTQLAQRIEREIFASALAYPHTHTPHVHFQGSYAHFGLTEIGEDHLFDYRFKQSSTFKALETHMFGLGFTKLCVTVHLDADKCKILIRGWGELPMPAAASAAA